MRQPQVITLAHTWTQQFNASATEFPAENGVDQNVGRTKINLQVSQNPRIYLPINADQQIAQWNPELFVSIIDSKSFNYIIQAGQQVENNKRR